MCGTFSADQVMTGLLTYTSDTTSRLRTLTARVDIRRDAQALRYETFWGVIFPRIGLSRGSLLRFA
ncbi:hypothetical protein DPMN_087928 [Dreissena polymorpha]|uniref:Uncharacterized protein n=1 Tax=Dreissena polymorpha TaxID=45954 RepID=A0A9D4KTL0_DREPO|nr:hypothetical protein DPMN_087928 [Dreissena polymorpha]